MDPNNFTSTLHPNFECFVCRFVCSKKGDWNRHITTVKHKKLTDPNNFTSKNTNEIQCKCGKIYKHKSSLSLHKKTCVDKKELIEDFDISNQPNEKALIMMLIKDNEALQKLVIEQSKSMLELCKNGTNNTTNSNNNISNNKTFNLQFFLNEECKDALNINEFVSSIKMDLDDLEITGKLGYVEGVTRIINKNLHDLDKTKRPIHCSDVKREVLYIKDENQWIKEYETNKPVLTRAIKQIAHENIKQISEWQKKHPDCIYRDSKNNDKYLNIVSNAMSGSTVEEQLTNYEKIITNVAKEVIIEK
jgi:hypothetical protein